MDTKIIKPDQFKSVPWKNGKGTTLELLFEDEDGVEGFIWRLSMAPVLCDGVFSDFSGYHRTLILVEGSGITLHHDNEQTDVLDRRFAIARFDGGSATKARLHDGQITDFNIMTKSGVCSAQVEIWEKYGSHKLSVQADQLLIISLDDSINISNPEFSPIRVEKMCLLQVNLPVEGNWEIAGKSVICITITNSVDDE